jgi:hypothetical protein
VITVDGPRHQRPAARTATTRTPTTPRRRAPVLARLPRVRVTPDRVRMLAALAVAASLALCAVTAAVFADVSSGLRVIGQQAAPEVTATTNLYFHLGDMDAQVANVLLVGGQQHLGIDRAQALAIYEQDRIQADRALQQAAAAAGSAPSAQRTLRTVLDGLGRYEALTAQAVYIEGLRTSAPGRPPAAALALYRQATDLMAGTILPAAQDLTSAYAAALDRSYQARRSDAQDGALWLALLGLVLLASLAAMQYFLARRYRRLLNPALALASVITVILTVTGAAGLSAQARHLQVAKQEAFDSVLALSQARAVSYDANADESRYLVDPARAARYQQAFLADSQRLAGLGPVGIFQYDAALAGDIDAYRRNHADVRFGGYLGTEFRNITFAGERAAAERALAAYQVYERDDRHIRALNARGDLRAAIAFDTSYAPGNSNWAFERYDQALVSVITINQRAFNAAIQAGQQGVSGWSGLIPAGAAVLLIAAVLAGVRPRLAEYR